METFFSIVPGSRCLRARLGTLFFLRGSGTVHFQECNSKWGREGRGREESGARGG